MVATVLGEVKTVQQACDRTMEVRWLKFWRLFSQIMLRVPPCGGRRGHGILPAHFAAPKNPRLIKFQINHNFSVFRVHARPFA